MAMFGRPSDRDDARAEAYAAWFRRRNPFAVASFVLGVFSLIEFGVLLVFGVAGIALGVVALLQLKRVRRPLPQTEPPASVASTGGTSDYPPDLRDRGHGLAWSGIVLSAVSLVIAVVLYSLPPGTAAG